MPVTFARIDGKDVKVVRLNTETVNFAFDDELNDMTPRTYAAHAYKRSVKVTTVTAKFANDVRGDCRYRITQSAVGALPDLLKFVGDRKNGVWNSDMTSVSFDTFI